MNYAPIRQKLKENQKKLQSMSGPERTKFEQHLIDEAKKESQQPLLAKEEEKSSAPEADGVKAVEQQPKQGQQRRR